jgi:dipeptidyl aminopeptidase/acylaminoacyl peptidase
MDRLPIRFKIDDMLDIAQPCDAELSPDGQYVAFGLGQAYKADKDTPTRVAIYVVEVSTGDMRLHAGSDTGTNESPCWSPDSQWLAFVSNRANPDEKQLYVTDLRRGETQALTDLRGAVMAPQWSPDGLSVAFLYSGVLDQEKPADPDPVVVDANPRFNRVWIVERETRLLRPVTPDTCHVFEYAWSPDGSALAVITSPHPNPAEGWYSAQLHTVRAATGKMQQVCTVQHQMGRLTWSPDGTSIAFVSGVMSDEGNISGDVFVVPAAGGEARCITPGIDHSLTWIDWRDRGILYGGRHIDSAVLGWLDPDSGTICPIAKGMYAINGIGPQRVSAVKNNTFAAVRESFTEPPNVYLGSLDGAEWRQLTHLPLDLGMLPPLHVENKHWSNPDGTPVHGFWSFRRTMSQANVIPCLCMCMAAILVICPRYASYWERLLAARGRLVLMPNPRGSWGRGHAYQAANVGDLGGGDWQDINAGVDYLIGEGLADPDRLAVGGWSYGGYLVAWAVTQTDRFRCAIAGASITNYESNYGVVSNREWQTTMFGSNVYDDVELHRSRSPLTHVKRVKTPTLLVHGACDVLAPPQQAIEYYTALKHFGVPTQLVLYPREPHAFAERAHQRDLYQRIGAWVDQYMFGQEQPDGR